MNPHRQFEIRCPIHGFITLNSWEKEIISQPAFQRLRRIRQLAWTDQVYPGAMHTRFEHSLGVMHTATLLYSAIRRASAAVLETELAYKEEGLNRDLQLVRLAALLHDVGHAPFSHAAESLFPEHAHGNRYKHENYSAAIVRTELKSSIEDHPLNVTNYGFKAEDVAALLDGSTAAKQLKTSTGCSQLLVISTVVNWNSQAQSCMSTESLRKNADMRRWRISWQESVR